MGERAEAVHGQIKSQRQDGRGQIAQGKIVQGQDDERQYIFRQVVHESLIFFVSL